ncbi:MAG TPA: hypothetical protein VF557_14105 [Jatrophihabitans sp.]|uniref:hypothetical protein n=1 Tax=Jatrophihabitans sp. TaxID=1932789 RepID=UPI002F143A4E
MSWFDLRGKAEQFADDLSTLLNNTVCNGIRLRPVIDEHTGVAMIGYNLSNDDLMSKGLPLTLGHKPPSGYLGLMCRLTADDTEGKHLMVVSSFYSFCADRDLSEELLHYDYEREKADAYPEAHLQVSASSPVWERLAAARGLGDMPLAKAHLPVGGRRYRPTVEDMIDFLVTEGLADGHPGWTTHVEAGRDRFMQAQLRAAVRRNPEVALEVLRSKGLC